MANTQTFQRLAPPGRGAMAAKRLFDIVCAACGLVVLSPLFLITALAVGRLRAVSCSVRNGSGWEANRLSSISSVPCGRKIPD